MNEVCLGRVLIAVHPGSRVREQSIGRVGLLHTLRPGPAPSVSGVCQHPPPAAVPLQKCSAPWAFPPPLVRPRAPRGGGGPPPPPPPRDNIPPLIPLLISLDSTIKLAFHSTTRRHWITLTLMEPDSPSSTLRWLSNGSLKCHHPAELPSCTTRQDDSCRLVACPPPPTGVNVW